MRGAAIDLGSNSFICLIFEKSEDGSMKCLDDQIILTRLSEGVDQTKILSPQALKRAEEAFKQFAEKFKKYKVEKVVAVATSAARDAKNQKTFIDLAAMYDIPIKILDGNQEAQLTFQGVKNNFENASGLIIDIGGGSTEYVLVSQGEMVQRVSLDMGAVRFTERYCHNSEFLIHEDKLREAVKKELSQNNVIEEFKSYSFEMLLAVSGTPTSAVSILINKFDEDKVDGFQLRSEDFLEIRNIFSLLNYDQRLERFPFIDPKRADVLPAGLVILEESMKFFDKSEIKVSTRGIRHGAAKLLFNSNNSFF